jgi:hypothetical protein
MYNAEGMKKVKLQDLFTSQTVEKCWDNALKIVAAEAAKMQKKADKASKKKAKKRSPEPAKHSAKGEISPQKYKPRGPR